MGSIVTNAAAIEVLLVEDSPGDVRLTREAFKDAKVHINLHVASDGAEAMAFLGREGQHVNSPRPDLILLGSEPTQKRRQAFSLHTAVVKSSMRSLFGEGPQKSRTAPFPAIGKVICWVARRTVTLLP
jgi:hypothetical protein